MFLDKEAEENQVIEVLRDAIMILLGTTLFLVVIFCILLIAITRLSLRVYSYYLKKPPQTGKTRESALDKTNLARFRQKLSKLPSAPIEDEFTGP
jgi:hypothetical protein